MQKKDHINRTLAFITGEDSFTAERQFYKRKPNARRFFLLLLFAYQHLFPHRHSFGKYENHSGTCLRAALPLNQR
jgi:hypothetical protein